MRFYVQIMQNNVLKAPRIPMKLLLFLGTKLIVLLPPTSNSLKMHHINGRSGHNLVTEPLSLAPCLNMTCPSISLQGPTGTSFIISELLHQITKSRRTLDPRKNGQYKSIRTERNPRRDRWYGKKKCRDLFGITARRLLYD